MRFFTKRIFLLLAVVNLQVVAQNKTTQTNCGTKTPPQQWEREFQKLVTRSTSNQTANRPQQAYVIPVIFHVIHSGEATGYFPNVSANEVNWQIATLNNDFAGTGIYSANYPANAFAAWAATANVSPASLDANGRIAIANCNIQFCLATKDTNGNVLPEPGIERIDYNTMGWPNPIAPSFSTLSTFSALYDTIIKPQTIWDPTKYLNVWVGLNICGIGGYAYYPALSTLNGLIPQSEIATPTNDGIYCSTFDFGYLNHVLAHEAGHWLGLVHTWGDAICGDDYCNDTPTAQSPTFGAPIYPYNGNACPGSGNGVMFMNYMDYSDNSSKYMFTPDQASRMQTAMANSPNRKDLGTHNLCSAPNDPPFAWFTSSNSSCTGKALNLSNMSLGWPATTSYTWSASGGTFSPGPQAVSPSIQFSAPGIYTINLTSSNGMVSMFTKTITVTSPSLYFSSTSQTICPGGVASFTVDGVNTYTWQPGNVMNAIVNFTPAASQIYTCVGLEVNDCMNSGLVEVIVEPCTGINTHPIDPLDLRIFPNPAQQSLSLELNNQFVSKLFIQITDAIGKIVHQETINTNTARLFTLPISTLDNGIYFIRTAAPDGSVNIQKFVKKE